MKKIFLFSIFSVVALAGFFLHTYVDAQNSPIQNVVIDKTSAQAYDKIEWTFNLNKNYPNPYYFYDPSDTPQTNPSNMTWFGADGVSVDLNITTPQGNSLKVPGFYFEDYKMKEVGGVAVLGKAGNPVWKARYSASQPGNYTWYLTVQDKDGILRYPSSGTNSFTVTPSTNPGFVRVSSKDSRFLAFDSGAPFIGTGSSEGVWANGSGLSFAYEKLFKDYNTNGINLLRVWDQSDFSLSVEGANPVWVNGSTINGAATGVILGNGQAKQGLRAANSTNPWYQRVVVAEVGKPHTLKGWVRGNSQISIRSVQSNATVGSVLAQTPTQNATNWTEVSLQYTPNADVVAIYLSGNGGVDDVVFGPTVSGNTPQYNILSDGDFERHFAKDNPGNDPNSDPQLARPLGNYFNQWSSYHFDKIVSDARAYNVYLQLCSCSGPWFTWPANPEDPNAANYNDAWWQKSWQRNFRYRVARWGYSTSVLAWERKNEYGHVTPGTPVYKFYETYGAFQKQTDPYQHLRTTSQGSQTYSPAFWSSNSFDLANYHDYMMSSRYPDALAGDETNFVFQFAWCLREDNKCRGSGLGIGDGTRWSGAAKPWIWGEIGAGMADWNASPSDAATKGEGGARYIHNIAWAGLFTPLGTTPLDWTMFSRADATSIKAFYDSRKALRAYFNGVTYDADRYTFIMSTPDKQTWWDGPTANVSNNKIRAFNMVSENKMKAYGWIQNRDNTWSRASTATPAVTGTVSVPTLTNGNYRLEIWNTRTGTIVSTTNQPVSNNTLTIPVTNLTNDFAYKALNTSLPENTPPPSTSPATPTATVAPTPQSTQSPTLGDGDVNNDKKVDLQDLVALFQSWGQSIGGSVDQFKDNVVNALDASVVMKMMRTVTATPTPAPTQVATATPTTAPTSTPSASNPPATATNQWTQHGGNAQRTSFIPNNIPHPWKWKWSWNGPNSSGGVVAGKTSLPRTVQAVIGDGRVYIAAGSRGVVALSEANGNEVWVVSPGGNINSTVAYDPETNSVFAVSSNGNLYKLNATNGQMSGTFNGNASNTIPLAPLVIESKVIFSTGSRVYAVSKSAMTQVWSYNTNSTVQTPPSYSKVRNRIIVGSADLYVHAIDNGSGQQAWRNKPTPRATGTAATELSYGWPVIADKTGVVLIKYRLDWNTMWTWSPWPTTNSEMRANLAGRPDQQALFAMKLDDGTIPFSVNVGHGGYGDGDFMPMGPQPVVKDLGNNEVAYMMIRGDSGQNDGRWDSKFGEVVLDNSLNGYVPGDVRFIEYGFLGWQRYGNAYSNIAATPTDEQPQLSMAGNYLLGGHWMNAYAMRIDNRTAEYGSYTRPIQSAPAPHITSSTNSSFTGCNLTTSHYCSGQLVQDGDVRTFPPQGFYIYYNQGRLYDTYWSGYAGWSANGNTLYYRSSDGAIIALESGNPTAMNELEDQKVAGAETKFVPDPRGVITPKQTFAYVGTTAKVRGELKEVFNNGKAVYLTFAIPHQQQFIVRIMKDEWKNFDQSPELLYKVGQTVEVQGLIETYQGGPVIYVKSPEQISID